jgi:uncharacterized protein (DUF362 family)
LISLVRSDYISEGLNRALDLAGDLQKLVKGKRVLIKVNLAVARSAKTGSTCDPRVLGFLIDECYKKGAEKVVVGDGSAVLMEDVLKVNPIDIVAKDHGALFTDLNRGSFRAVEVKDAMVVNGYILSEPVLGAEVLINLAKMKTHAMAGVTLCMKNLMGCILGWGNWDGKEYHWKDFSDRRKIHTLGCHKALVDLNTLIHPALNIIDGFIAQNGESPFGGEPVDMRTFIVGEDIVAVDATGVRVMGFNPASIGYLRIAAEQGLGDLNPKVVGDKVKEVKTVFKPPKKWKGKHTLWFI